MWVGTTSGFGRFVGNQFVSVSPNSQLQNVGSILEDARGHLWLLTRSVVATFDPRSAQAAEQSGTGRISYRKFDAADGFAGLTRATSPNAALGPRGTVWVASDDGVLIITPDSVPSPTAPSPVRIEKAVADERSYDPDVAQRLPRGTSRIAFEFTSLDLTAPSTLSFRYRLHGVDQEWVECGACRGVAYGNLQPGAYQFLVAAQSRGGPWADPTIWTFAVAPFFYQTRAFFGACLALGLLVCWGIWRLRVERIKREYASILAERARLGREVHDTILQGMVGVALQLQCTLESIDQPIDMLKARLEHSRVCLEEYVRQTRHAIWALRSSKPERIDMGALLRDTATNLAFGLVPIDVTVRGEPRTDHATTAENILKIGQEAVANAIRHSGATLIAVELSYEPLTTELCVRDNGRGFDPTLAQDDGRPSWGLSSMSDRANEIRGDLKIDSGAWGTTVRLSVPHSQM
jgi:signal transduction histidine kinase